MQADGQGRWRERRSADVLSALAVLTAIILAVGIALWAGAPAEARQDYGNVLAGKYPLWPSNVPTDLRNCKVCHQSTYPTTSARNQFYGATFESQPNHGKTDPMGSAAALANAGRAINDIKPLDSDSDGFSNDVELLAGFSPSDPAVHPPAFNYSLSNSGGITVTPGASGFNTITASLTAGASQSVSFSVSGLPSGATPGFNPGACNPTCTSQLTISTTGSTPTGTFPIAVTGNPLNRATTFNLVVNPPPFNYSLSNSGGIAVTPGASGFNTITARLTAGASQSVSYSVSGLPSGATPAFNPGACNPNCTSQLTISTTGSTLTGTFPITVTGNPLGRTTTFNLVVSSAPSVILSLNQPSFTAGERFELSLLVANPSTAINADVYFGVMLPPAAGPGAGCPNHDAIVLFVNTLSQPVVTCLSGDPSTFQPLFQNVTIPASLPVTTIPNFFEAVWPASAPAGTYEWFMAFAEPGTLNLFAVGSVNASFTP